MSKGSNNLKPATMIALLLCFVILPVFAAEEKAKSFQSGVVFTFDDRGIDGWVKQIPLFEKYGAKVTFFVDHFYTLKPEQIEGLKKLEVAGHTIGCHGVKHRKAVDTIAQVGVEEYLAIEIHPAVKAMAEAGFKVTSFAYPSSQRNEASDEALRGTFRHLRGGAGPKENQRIRDLDRIFIPVDQIAQRYCLIGTGIDYAGTEKRPDYIEQIKEAMDRAKAEGEIVVFYAHGISENGPGHHIQPKALEEILAYAQTIGLPTLTYDDLP